MVDVTTSLRGVIDNLKFASYESFHLLSSFSFFLPASQWSHELHWPVQKLMCLSKEKVRNATSIPWSVPCIQSATHPPPNHKPHNCLGWKRLLSRIVTPALPCSPPSHVHIFQTLPGMAIPPFLWAACSSVPSHSKTQFCEAASMARKSRSSRPIVGKPSHAFFKVIVTN